MQGLWRAYIRRRCMLLAMLCVPIWHCTSMLLERLPHPIALGSGISFITIYFYQNYDPRLTTPMIYILPSPASPGLRRLESHPKILVWSGYQPSLHQILEWRFKPTLVMHRIQKISNNFHFTNRSSIKVLPDCQRQFVFPHTPAVSVTCHCR